MEIIPKPAQRLPLWQNILFYFSLALLLAAALSYFILNNSQKNNSTVLENLKIASEMGKTAEERVLEDKITSYQKKINDFGKLLEEQKAGSNFLMLLEGLTHPKVWFSDFEFDLKENRATISGQTDGFQSLGQQLVILRKESNLSRVDLSNVEIDKEGKVGFVLDITINPALF